MRELQKKFDVSIIGVLTLLFMTALAFYNNYAVKSSVADLIRAKKNTALSCVPDQPTDLGILNAKAKNRKFNLHNQSNDDRPTKNNSGGCSHPMGANALCDISGSKRRACRGPTC